MKVRECAGKSLKEFESLGLNISSVTKYPFGYLVVFRNGIVLEARGHDRIEDLKEPRQARSADRIQHYGEFGSSI